MPSKLEALLKNAEASAEPARQEAAWAELTRFLRMYVRAKMTREARLSHESMDVVNSVVDSFIEDYRSRKIEFSSEDKLLGYLAQAASHKLIDMHRRRMTKKRGGDTDHSPIGPDLDAGEIDPRADAASASQVVRHRELEDDIRGSLEGDERSLWDLYRQGLPWAEIARHLEITDKAARTRMSRLRQKLRKSFGRDLIADPEAS